MVAKKSRWSSAFGPDVTSAQRDSCPDAEPDQIDEARLAGLMELYERWSPLVFSVALASLGGVAEAEDATRRVFLAVWDTRPLPASSTAEMTTWLVGLTRAACDPSPHARSSPAGAPGKDSASSESKPDLPTELLIADEMSQQSPVRLQVLRMALGERLTSTQIAERTQLPVDEVKKHLARALIALRDRVAVNDDAR